MAPLAHGALAIMVSDGHPQKASSAQQMRQLPTPVYDKKNCGCATKIDVCCNANKKQAQA